MIQTIVAEEDAMNKRIANNLSKILPADKAGKIEVEV